MCARDRGMATPEALVGVLVALFAVLSALALARGLVQLGSRTAVDAEGALERAWALDRIVREVSRTGLGVCPAGPCADEAIELTAAAALVVRGDLDGDDRERAADVEPWLSPSGAVVPTGNDEVTAYVLRGGTDSDLVFEADLDSVDRITLPDGTLLARRDGVVEPISCGDASGSADVVRGTLYRVTFTLDARWAGTGRFRVVEPLAENVTRFAVEAFDAPGAALSPCGGADDAAARACRAAVRRVRITLCGAAAPWTSRCIAREVALGVHP